MSSAAVHPIQQPSQQYPRSSPARDSYVAEPSPDLSASPASSRKQPKYAGGNGAPPNTPQSLQQPYSSAPSSSMTTPRQQQQYSSQNQTPASRTSASSRDAYYSDRQSQQQSSIPYRQSQSAATSSPYASRSSQAPYTPELGSDMGRDLNTDNAGSTPAAMPSRRKDNRVFSEPANQSSNNNFPQRKPVQSRSATAVGQPPVDTSLLREDSAILNRLVITDPQEDVERERARVAEARPTATGTDVTPVTGLGLVGSEGVDDGGRGGHRSRQEHLKAGQQPRRETRFGEYILGQTVGEGEFGKVKMGWKKEGGVQVAIKLIRRESLGNNPNRLPKIYREIAILRGLQHPNIVRLHEMVETERHIGIILEYASGGELFDYILNHRYLKDNAARRLFAQLVSGVGYLHKRGIVHRDLKLENLLLDRNRNIIITDFGFANTFNPIDELGDEIEYNLSNKDFVHKMNLEQIQSDGHRRGDLMQTSCGSPCYAAPELVVSDSLYTGRKVDVWSCGVILYAMLAGYLPFDDDPANPEGDNINLLYKYIVSTPLTFPEYVTPHARDLLRRILVPDPRKRADLFEVARHSWLSEYAHVVGFITSTTTKSTDMPPAVVSTEDSFEPSGLARSASVREPVKSPVSSGGLGRPPPAGDAAEQSERPKTSRDAKRRTVQLEYVAPQTQTARGESRGEFSPVSPISQASPPPMAQGTQTTRTEEIRRQGPADQAMPPPSQFARPSQQSRPAEPAIMLPPARPVRDPPRAVSDSTAFQAVSPVSSNARPSTRGSMGGGARLPSRGNSYGQPVAATVAPTNAEGRFSQPTKADYGLPQDSDGRDPRTGRPISQQFPTEYQVQPPVEKDRPRHRRTSTMESITSRIFGRSNSTRRQSQQQEGATPRPDRPSRAYPPVSMKNSVANEEAMPRPSSESRRTSFGFSRKNSEDPSRRSSKRFSFLPQAFSRMSLSTKEEGNDDSTGSRRQSIQQTPRVKQESKPSGMAFGQGRSRSPSAETTGSSIPVVYDSGTDSRHRQGLPNNAPQRGATAPNLNSYNYTNPNVYQTQQSQQDSRDQQQQSQQQQPYSENRTPSTRIPQPQQQNRASNRYSWAPQSTKQSESVNASGQYAPQRTYPQGFNEYDGAGDDQQNRRATANLQKNNRKFGEAYESGGNGGSSGGARRVMDWFRKRGKERAN